MKNKEEALEEIIAIARRYDIRAKDINSALDVSDKNQTNSSITTKLFSYLGGIFIFSGVCIFTGMFWDDMGSMARVVITLGSGFTAFILGIVALSDNRYDKVVTPFFLIAATLQPTGLFVFLSEYFEGDDPLSGIIVVFFVMTIQQLTTFLVKKRTSLLFFTLLFGSLLFAATFEKLNVDSEIIGTIIGFSLLCIAYAINKTVYEKICSFWFFCSSILFLWGSFDILEDSAIEIVYLGISAFIVYISTVVKSKALLLVSTLSILGYLVHFTDKYFANSIGWPLSLIILGFVFMGISSVALRIQRKYF